MQTHLTNFLKQYIFIVLLLILVLIRMVFYTFPQDLQDNFTATVIIERPVVVEESQKIIENFKYKIITYDLPLKNDSEVLEIGDVIKVTGQKYYSLIYPEEVEFVKESRFKFFFKLKEKVLNQAFILLPEPHASLLNGILWGIDPNVSPEFHEKLIYTGLIHIVVVSGYNISVLFSVASKIFIDLKKGIFFGILFSIIYCLFVGFDPPIIRALIMGVIVGVGRLKGEVKNMVYLLTVVGLLMTLISPDILFSVSFQLTFLATLGILVLNGPLEEIFSKSKIYLSLPKLIKEDVLSSISAQVFVLPIIAFYFERVSFMGFLSNPVILWTTPLIMFTGFVFVFLSLLNLTFIAKSLSFILAAPLELFVGFVNLISNINFFQVLISINHYHLIAYYLLLTALVVMLHNKYYLLIRNLISKEE